jgi:cell wall-associated NlpC family hydrolase
VHTHPQAAVAPQPPAVPLAARAKQVQRTQQAQRTQQPEYAQNAKQAPHPKNPNRARTHEARHIDALAQRRSRRRMAATATAAYKGLVSSLLFAVPANATPAGVVATDAHGHTASQMLAVSSQVSMHTVQHDSSVAAALAGIVASQDGVHSASAAAVIAAALQAGGARQSIVETALSYLGDPYVLGGSDHTGIDCSGLTMQAYASVGIHLVHLVSAQDAVGVAIPESAARPGDLVVFDDNEHIGIYLGANLLIAAPEEGRPVTVEQVWSGIPHHFTRILPAAQ